MLRAIWGYRYADLLLDLGRFDEVETRLEYAMLEPDKPKGWGEGVFAKPLLELGYIRLRVRQADHFGEKRDWERVRRFARSFEEFGEPDRRVGPEKNEAITARPTRSKRELRRRARPQEQQKQSYERRLDTLIPSFRTGLAGVERLSGNLKKAAEHLQFAENAAKMAGITLFSNEICVERARILLAAGRTEEALAVLLAAPDSVSYRSGERARLIAELTQRPP